MRAQRYLVKHLGDDPLPFLLLMLCSNMVLVHDPIRLPVLAARIAATASTLWLGRADSDAASSALCLSFIEYKDLLPTNLRDGHVWDTMQKTKGILETSPATSIRLSSCCKRIKDMQLTQSN